MHRERDRETERQGEKKVGNMKLGRQGGEEDLGVVREDNEYGQNVVYEN